MSGVQNGDVNGLPLAACLLLLVFGASACGPARTPEPVEGNVSCPTGTFGSPPTMSCQAAVGAAISNLPALHGTIKSVEMGYGFWCPRQVCSMPRPDVAHVIVWFESVDPVVITIKENDATGQLSATETVPFRP
jgi:hypothetical protein